MDFSGQGSHNQKQQVENPQMASESDRKQKQKILDSQIFKVPRAVEASNHLSQQKPQQDPGFSYPITDHQSPSNVTVTRSQIERFPYQGFSLDFSGQGSLNQKQQVENPLMASESDRKQKQKILDSQIFKVPRAVEASDHLSRQKPQQAPGFSYPITDHQSPTNVTVTRLQIERFPYQGLSPYGNASTGLGFRRYGMHATPMGPFTPYQLLELDRQILVSNYMAENLPVSPNLLIFIKKFIDRDETSKLKTDGRGFLEQLESEPGRCRRNDGRGWRFSKDVIPDQKYCESHLGRGSQLILRNSLNEEGGIHDPREQMMPEQAAESVPILTDLVLYPSYTRPCIDLNRSYSLGHDEGNYEYHDRSKEDGDHNSMKFPDIQPNKTWLSISLPTISQSILSPQRPAQVSAHIQMDGVGRFSNKPTHNNPNCTSFAGESSMSGSFQGFKQL